MLRNVFLTSFFIACLCFGFCEEPQSDVEAGALKLASTVDGAVLFYGWEEGYYVNYDDSQLTEKQKAEYKAKGLKVIAELFEDAESYEDASGYAETLAKWYYVNDDMKKSIFWTFKAAENGSSFCMWLLSNAYHNGTGVVQDLEEYLKWKYLGAAAGDERCKKWVNENGINLLLSKDLAPMVKEAQKRAKKWMEAHSELFASPN